MKFLILALILMSACLLPGATARAEVAHNVPYFDDGDLPPGWDDNPYAIMASMNCWTKPILDHTGQPHLNGHLVQLIMDGGNNTQDPPNPDGTPGGDDSLAYGNFNMITVIGLDVEADPQHRTGLFYSHRAFIPLYQNRSFFMRIWEGNDIRTAPYYQDTISYTAGDDQGGSMIRLRSGFLGEVDWTFGQSKARPASVAEKTPDKK